FITSILHSHSHTIFIYSRSHHTFLFFFFFFNHTATTEIYTLSLHDALPICTGQANRKTHCPGLRAHRAEYFPFDLVRALNGKYRSEEHTSELQSRGHLVCRLLLEKKKSNKLSSYVHR